MHEKYKTWKETWNTTLDQICHVIPEENIYPLTIQPPATQMEVEEIEKQLGYTLPATFRHTLLHFSKGVNLYWNMYEEVEDIIPEEFEGISSGNIHWGIDHFHLEDLETRANQMDIRGNSEEEYQNMLSIMKGIFAPEEFEKWEKESNEARKNSKPYRSKLHNKLKLMSVDNGDVIAFDMLAKGEPPVVYWDHETEEVTYLASSFHVFMDRITQLYCIGNESWQYGPFLTDDGIDSDGENAKNWREWFQAFVSQTKG